MEALTQIQVPSRPSPTRSILLFALLLISHSAQCQQLAACSAGELRFTDSIRDAPKTFKAAIWLPPGYTEARQYPVIYMHDGQMLFDAASTWNQQEWMVDESMAALIRADSKLSAIVVGIWNSGENRFRDYFPQKVFESLSPENQDSISSALNKVGRVKGTFHPASDAYLRFVANELKPFMDRNFSTLSNRESTFMAGSSMGGLISLYALCEYPEVFGGIACFSTHWTGIHRNVQNPFPQAMMEYLSKNLPPASKNHRIYLGTGTETLDSLYKNHHEAACSLIMSKGYSETHFMHHVALGENHSEKAWSKRFPDAVRFLLSRE
jgi:predicted alpha/beta superfamily hydrolase